MSILKIKAKIYQYTGLYLADKEELKYVHSKEFWKEFKRGSKFNKANDMTEQDLFGLLIGSWQADNGFHRRFNIKRFPFSGTPFHMKLICWLEDFFCQLRDDLKKKSRRKG